MVLFYIPLWICILLIIFYNLAIYRTLRNTGDADWFVWQSIFAVAFFVTWAPSTIWSGMSWNGGGSFLLDLAAAICEPLAAFWNLLIFLRDKPTLRKKILYYLCFCREDLYVELYPNSPNKPNKRSSVLIYATAKATTSRIQNEEEDTFETHSSHEPPILEVVEEPSDMDQHPLAIRMRKMRDDMMKAQMSDAFLAAGDGESSFKEHELIEI
jgi:hypothetical protein